MPLDPVVQDRRRVFVEAPVELFVDGVEVDERAEGEAQREFEEEVGVSDEGFEDVEGGFGGAGWVCGCGIGAEAFGGDVLEAVMAAAEDAGGGEDGEGVLGVELGGVGFHGAGVVLVEVVCGAFFALRAEVHVGVGIV